MITLYSTPRTRALRPRWILEEMGVPYQMVAVSLSSPDPEYLKINPLGRVPSIKDGDLVLFESSAICQYLADKYPDKGFSFKPGTSERAKSDQWIFFAMTMLERAIENGSQSDFDEAAEVVSAAVTGKDFLIGDRITVADIIMGSVLIWARSIQMLKGPEELVRYTKGLRGRPAFMKAIV
jgi:glutathione S-transferase